MKKLLSFCSLMILVGLMVACTGSTTGAVSIPFFSFGAQSQSANPTVTPSATPTGAVTQTATPTPALAATQNTTPVITTNAVSLPEFASGGITVTGNAQVLVVPDEVILTLGIETNHKVLSTARRDNDQVMEEVLQIANRYGVKPEYIQTDFINIEPRYINGEHRPENFEGYFVRKTVVIKLKDISQFEGLYGDVLEAGVNYIHGIEFRTSELRKYRDQARSMAIQAAREKAVAMAGELDQKIGRVKMIQENSTDWWGSYSSWWYRSSGFAYQNVVQEAGGSGVDLDGSLAPGQISVTAGVTVEFELLP